MATLPLHKEEDWWLSLDRLLLLLTPLAGGTGESPLPPAPSTTTTQGPSWLGPVHRPPTPCPSGYVGSEHLL